MPVDQPPAGAAIANDDVVVVFRTRASNIRGRLVRFGPTLDAIITPHKMPELASQSLSEAVALAALCGSAMPPGCNLNLQTRSDGAVSILVADYAAAGRLRGYARYDAAKIAEVGQLPPNHFIGGILGAGHLAITLDAGPGEERYQGVLAFDGAPLNATTGAYFEQRENLPTFIRLAVARHFIGGRQSSSGSRWHWRASGLMLQNLAASPERQEDAGEDWHRIHVLAATVEDHELLDPEFTAQRLLLFPRRERYGRASRTAFDVFADVAARRSKTFFAHSARASYPTCSTRTVKSSSPASSVRRDTRSRSMI